MFIQRTQRKSKDKVYHSGVLIENYREGKKVKHRTIATLTKWPKNIVDDLEKLLKGKAVTSIEDYIFINGMEYKNKYQLNVVEANINKTHQNNGSQKEEYFTHITDIPINKNNYSLISHTGRLRWKIENEGFNEQKNCGYKLQHKYSRTSFNASQNYYQCLQIAT